MTKSLDLIAYGRKGFVDLLNDLSVEQINKIPTGFNNNLIWNLAHIIAVQQVFCYVFTGQTPLVDAALLETYKRGSVPEGVVPQEEITRLKNFAIETIAQTAKDFQAGKFTQFKQFHLASANLTVVNIDEALLFVAFHEGIHLGTAQSIKKAVTA